MHAVFIVPILVVAALGRATLAWWRFCGFTHVQCRPIRPWSARASSASAHSRFAAALAFFRSSFGAAPSSSSIGFAPARLWRCGRAHFATSTHNRSKL